MQYNNLLEIKTAKKVFVYFHIHAKGSSEIWSDKLKVLYNRHTESRRDGGNAQCHGGADGTKSDGGVAYRFLITILR